MKRIYLAARVIADGRIRNCLGVIIAGLGFDEIRDDAQLRGLCVADTDDAQHATLIADPRVFAMANALNIDDAAPPAMVNYFAARGIDITGMTRRQVCRKVARVLLGSDAEFRIAALRARLAAEIDASVRLGNLVF
jgi:hypothetical protein